MGSIILPGTDVVIVHEGVRGPQGPPGSVNVTWSDRAPTQDDAGLPGDLWVREGVQGGSGGVIVFDGGGPTGGDFIMDGGGI